MYRFKWKRKHRWVLPLLSAFLLFSLALTGCFEESEFEIGQTSVAQTQNSSVVGGQEGNGGEAVTPSPEPGTQSGQTGEGAPDVEGANQASNAGPNDTDQGGQTQTDEDQQVNTGGSVELTFNPPLPEDAPEEIREAVLLGRDIIADTPGTIPEYTGNNVSCTNCHFENGLTQGGKNGGISLVGVGATYPQYRSRQDYAVTMVTRLND